MLNHIIYEKYWRKSSNNLSVGCCNLKIHFLAEDVAKFYSFGIKAENGISLLIEFNDMKLLFDVGQSDLF